MAIVPEQDNLIVETRVTPQDIDQVKLKQAAILRFTSFNQRSTPELDGIVSRIGADVSRDDKIGPAYFVVRVTVTPEQIARLEEARLVPGMPVEVFIPTSQRTLLSYLLKPFSDQARRAFRER